MGDVDGALALARGAFFGLGRKFGPDHWRTWEALGTVAACLAAAGDADAPARMRRAMEELGRRLYPSHREVRWLAMRLAAMELATELAAPPVEPITIDPLRLAFLLVLDGRLPAAHLKTLAQPEAVTEALGPPKTSGERGAAWLEGEVNRLAAAHRGAEPDPLWRGWMERVNGPAVDRLRAALAIHAAPVPAARRRPSRSRREGR